MDKPVLSPSKGAETPPEKTLKLLHERLDLAEQEAKKLSEQLSEYGFNAGVQKQSTKRSVIDVITPFEAKSVDEIQFQVLKKNYEDLVSRVCRTESTVQSLKLALVSLEAEKSLMNKDSVAETLSANEAYQKKLMKLKKELVTSRKQLDESEKFRAQTEQDFERLRDEIGVKTGSNANVIEKVKELKVTRERLTKWVNELREELGYEKNVRVSLETSHEELLERVTEMEQLVEKENGEMKVLSGDCGRLKKELSQTKERCDREYQTRMQLEKLIERLNGDVEDMESKLLNISNERKQDSDTNLAKFKRENRELKQQLEALRKSNETLKEVNLDLEQRYKDINKAFRVTADDNKILIAQHRESLEKEKLAFAEKLNEQDKLLDQAKESIMQELVKERQAAVEKDEENVKMKGDLSLLQKLLGEKDAELIKLTRLLEKLSAERDNMMEENDKAIFEIKHELENFVSEKISLEAQFDQTKVLRFSQQDVRHFEEESKRIEEQNERLEEECEKLRTRLLELEHQQTNQDRVNTAFQNMLEDKKRLAYEKGVLQSKVEKMNVEMASHYNIKAEHEKLRHSAATSKKKWTETVNELQECRRKLRDMEQDTRDLQSIVAEKENEVKFLMRNKDEALKETELVIQKTETYEKTYLKKVDSLQRALVHSKEDNRKLASTLETVITSHTQLQASCEHLQTELGKRDSQAKYTEEERSKMQSNIWELNGEVESLQDKLLEMQTIESSNSGPLQRALHVLEEDREKLVNTVEPLIQANKELQVSLETLANEVSRKEVEIKKLREASLHEKKEMTMQSNAKERKVDEIQKQSEKEMRMKHKKEITKLRKEFQDMVNMKNTLKEEKMEVKRQLEEKEERHKRMKEKLKLTKTQLDQCLKLQRTQENEVDVARQKIEAMGRELATLEDLKAEYTRNNAKQTRSLQEFVSQLTELQEEFRTLSNAQRETSVLCRQKEEEMNKEKVRRKEMEVTCHRIKSREKQLREMHQDGERRLEEANFESQQVAGNLQEAHEWFKDKFTNLQSELSKSRKIQSVLQKDNVDQYKALQVERKRAEEATDRAKEIIKSSRMMISKLVGQVVEGSDESREIQEAMAKERLKSVHKMTKNKERLASGQR